MGVAKENKRRALRVKDWEVEERRIVDSANALGGISKD
jgi:hypothetical protein